MNLRLKIILLLFGLVATALLNAGFTLILEKNGENKLSWVNHTHDVMTESAKFLSSLTDAETGQRGFLLTKDIGYLQPYYSGITDANYRFERLRTLTSDSPEQQSRLQRIQNLMKLKLEELDETIILTQEGKFEESLSVVAQDTGKIFMDEIRALLGDFMHREELLLQERKGDLKAVKAQINTLIIVEVVVMILLAGFAVVFINRNLFSPLERLLSGTKKMEQGSAVDVSDLVQKDEMGYLLAAFFRMSEKVYDRTQQLDYKANHDELTGLYNRMSLPASIKEAIRGLESGSKMAIVFLDLNNFKQLNDTLGHEAGDTMLKALASRLAATVHPGDLVFRLGGDEFVLLLNDIGNLSSIDRIISRLSSNVQKPVAILGKSINISLSLGVSIAPDHTEDPTQLLKMADIAMYESKKDGRGKYRLFDVSMLHRPDDEIVS